MYPYMLGTSSARTNAAATERRILLKLRAALAEQFAPPICARIKATRERLKHEAMEAGGREAAREFSQERVAQKLHLSLKAYRAYEKNREPHHQRRQDIARALGLDPDYFEVTVRDADSERLSELERRAAEQAEKLDRILEILEAPAPLVPPKRKRSA